MMESGEFTINPAPIKSNAQNPPWGTEPRQAMQTPATGEFVVIDRIFCSLQVMVCHHDFTFNCYFQYSPIDVKVIDCVAP